MGSYTHFPPFSLRHQKNAMSNMDAIPVANNTAGEPESTKNKALETGAGLVQNFDPPKRLCAHLNAFHTYYNEPGRHVEANHYCAHLYEKLDPEERKLWHSHVFEVKSGMLIMPAPTTVPNAAWSRRRIRRWRKWSCC